MVTGEMLPRDLNDPSLSRRRMLEQMFEHKLIALERDPLFDTAPQPLPASVGWGRVEGMLLDLAIGDSLGNTTEGQLPHVRRGHRGEVRDFLPNRYADHRPVGVPSDDTQLAFWTLEQLLTDGRLVPDHLAQAFGSRQIYGIGGTVAEFLAVTMDRNVPWFQAGVASAGNGALMRIAPLLLPHLRTPSRELWADTALVAMITHNDRASTSAYVAWVAMLWDLLGMDAPPAPAWWVTRYVALARPLEGDDTIYAPRCAVTRYAGFMGPLWRFVEEKVIDAWQRQIPVLDACNGWCSGAYLLETLPCVLYILMHHAHNPEEALVRAVNDTKDNDTVAAIVGTSVGALHGTDALPKRWRDGLLGRTAADDDGRVFALLDAARVRWWDAPGTGS